MEPSYHLANDGIERSAMVEIQGSRGYLGAGTESMVRSCSWPTPVAQVVGPSWYCTSRTKKLLVYDYVILRDYEEPRYTRRLSFRVFSYSFLVSTNRGSQLRKDKSHQQVQTTK